MDCPVCSEEIPDASRFCAYCGTPLRRCPSCQRVYRADAEFCGACGTTLMVEAKRVPMRTANLGERIDAETIAAEDDKWLARDREGVYGFLYDPRFPEQRFYIYQGDITIGAGDKNDVVVDKPAVSWNHALLVSRNDRLLIQDSASTNGTFVNEMRVTRPRDLKHGDLIRFGNVEYRLWIKPQIRNRS